MAELTDAQVERAAQNIEFFRQAVAKYGLDKEPEMVVGTGWLTCPLYHIAPDEAMEADWSEDVPTWVDFARRTGLPQEAVSEFSDWWDEDGSKNPDLRDLVYEAMGHDETKEEWARGARSTEQEGDDDGP